jgi:hypothetical protein
MLVSYRVEDFVAGGTPLPKGQTLISWKLGLRQKLGLPSNTMLSDRPESIPLRIKDTGAGTAVINNIIARSTDKLRVIRNQRTYAAVAHAGYAIGIYDTNAIESNRFANLTVTNPDSDERKVCCYLAASIVFNDPT